MVKKPRPSQSSKFTATWLSPRLQVSSKIVENSAHFERISQQKQRWRPPRGSSGHAYKKGDSSCQKTHYSGILQQTFSGSKTHESLATSNRSKYVKPSFTCTDIQDGNSRIYQEIDSKRGVGHLDRPHRRLFPCSNSSTISKISEISDQKRGFSVSSSSFWCRDSSPRVHSHCQRGQTHSSSQEPQNPSISGRLASSVTIKRSMSQRFGKVSSIGPRTRLDYQFSKIGIDTHAKLDFLGYHFDLQRGLVFPTQNKLDRLNAQTVSIRKSLVLTPRKLMSLIGTLASLEKTVPLGRLHMRPFQWYLKSHWKFPQSLDIRIPVTGNFLKHLKWWEDIKNLMAGAPIHPQVHNTLVFTDASQKGWGAHLNKIVLSGLWSNKEAQLHINVLELKAVLLALKGFQEHLQGQTVLICSDNSTVVAYLNKEGGTHSIEMCALIWKILAFTNSRRIQIRARHVPGSLNVIADSLSRRDKVIQTEWSLHQQIFNQICKVWDTPMVDLFATHLNSKLQTSNLFISCPRQKGLENRCIEYLLGRPRRLCLLSSSHPATSNSKNNNIPMQDDSTGSRVARDAMVLGSGGSLDQGTSTAPSLEDITETTTFQQVPQQRGVPESTCVASGFQESNSGRFSWTIYGQWCTENKVDITSTAVPQVAEFLNYLFTVKNLKPATITGYRTAIADALGSQGEFISISELNRLIASLTRDRPKPNRSIPTWDLSLVLLGLTKPPFEPLSEAPLKWLTYKTVFLLALASGKRRSEIHAWTHSSVSSRRNWSEVTVSPSPAFLAKNQLASDGPDSIKPVVIPALTTMLDSSLVEDKSLCPVRALKVYLEKTKSMRKGKALLFVSLREGYSKDITRITISQWIKHTIQTCYQSSDTDDQQVTQVRAHDVRAMAASLAFKGGISLEQVLSSCYWKSHNTFTNFYLKDICWENDDIFKLGPIVSEQHVVNN